MEVIRGIFLDDVQKAKDTLLEHGEVMRALRDRLKEENVPVEEQNEIRKKVIDILAEDLLITTNLSINGGWIPYIFE